MTYLSNELMEVEMLGNIEIHRYVSHIEKMGWPNIFEDWFYDQTEIYLQEMILNIKHQIIK